METGTLKVDHIGSHGSFILADIYLCAKNEDPSSVIFFVLTSP